MIRDDIIMLSVFIFGLITLIYSLWVSVDFHIASKEAKGATKKLAERLRDQLLGEAYMTFATLAFSFAAYTKILQSWSPLLQSLLRTSMFFVAACTSIRLKRAVRETFREMSRFEASLEERERVLNE